MEYRSLVHGNSWEAEQLRSTGDLRRWERIWLELFEKLERKPDSLEVQLHYCRFDGALYTIQDWWGDVVEQRYEQS